jgi:hypothetical protein
MDDKGGLADTQRPRLLVGIALLPSKVGWTSALLSRASSGRELPALSGAALSCIASATLPALGVVC